MHKMSHHAQNILLDLQTLMTITGSWQGAKKLNPEAIRCPHTPKLPVIYGNYSHCLSNHQNQHSTLSSKHIYLYTHRQS